MAASGGAIFAHCSQFVKFATKRAGEKPPDAPPLCADPTAVHY
jgi:hypothetical protein